jgi:hypothetical protein
MVCEHYGRLFGDEVPLEEKTVLWQQILDECRRLGHSWTKV